MSPAHPTAELELGIARQVEAAREFALFGATPRARAICASVFLDHGMTLSRDRSLQRNFIECLLLLYMTGLLIRLLRAMEGVTLGVTPVAGAGSGKLQLDFRNGVTFTIPCLGPGAGRAARAKAAVRWSQAIQDAAARTQRIMLADPVVAASVELEAVH